MIKNRIYKDELLNVDIHEHFVNKLQHIFSKIYIMYFMFYDIFPWKLKSRMFPHKNFKPLIQIEGCWHDIFIKYV